MRTAGRLGAVSRLLATFFVASRRRGWNEFLRNDVEPVLPTDVEWLWDPRSRDAVPHEMLLALGALLGELVGAITVAVERGDDVTPEQVAAAVRIFGARGVENVTLRPS